MECSATAVAAVSPLTVVEARAWADLFQLVQMATVLPTVPLARAIADDDLFADIASMAADLGVDPAVWSDSERDARSCAGRSNLDEVFHELRRDYTQLFAHPKTPAVRAYESLFLAGKDGDELPPLFLNPVCADVLRVFERFGLARSREQGANVSPDSAAVEAELMARAYAMLAEALEDEGPVGCRKADGRAQTLSDTIDEFRHGHVDRWFGDFFEAVGQKADSPYYRYLGAVGAELF